MIFDKQTMVGIAARLKTQTKTLTETEATYNTEIKRLTDLRDERLGPLRRSVARLENGLRQWHQHALTEDSNNKQVDLIYVTLGHIKQSGTKIVVAGETEPAAAKRLAGTHPELTKTKTIQVLNRDSITQAVKDGKYELTEDGELVNTDGEATGVYIIETPDTWKVNII